MDATARRSFCSVPTFFALTVLACFSFVVAFSGGRQEHYVVLQRRDGHRLLVARQSDAIPTPTEGPVSSTPLSLSPSVFSSASTPIPSPPLSSSAHLSSGRARPTSIPPASSDGALSLHLMASQSIPQSSSRSLESSTVSSTAESKIFSTALSSSAPSQTTTFPSEPLNVAPATTFALTNVQPTSFTETATITPILPSPSETGTSASASAASNSSGFWKNKGAVAATFVIISLVLGAILIVVIITMLKRRSVRKQQLLHEDLFEKYSEQDHRSSSPGLSINAVPMDAFASRDVSYNNTLPASSYRIAESQRAFHSSTPVQHPDFYNEPNAPSQYTSPSQLLATRKAAPPTAFRNPAGQDFQRDSYQQSIDSFYGAAGQPPSDFF